MNLPVAILVAVLLHLLILVGTEMFPGLRAAWIPDIPERPLQPQPLSFTFVDLPRELPEPDTTPEDAVASDRTRRASSQPPPEDAPPSPDPFSEGNTDQRVDSVPSPEVAPQQASAQAPPDPGQERASVAADTARDAPDASARPAAPEEMFPAPRDDAEEREEAREPAPEPLQEGLLGAMRPFSSRDVERFDHAGTASVSDFGPISFDTVGIDWGPYARRIVEIIRARWIERMPQAARLGLKGRSVISFRITVDGSVFAIVLEDGSGHRALDKAAEFSIEGAELPPLPPEFLDLGKEDVGVTFQFYYNMRIPKR
jgi:TonB family protein